MLGGSQVHWKAWTDKPGDETARGNAPNPTTQLVWEKASLLPGAQSCFWRHWPEVLPKSSCQNLCHCCLWNRYPLSQLPQNGFCVAWLLCISSFWLSLEWVVWLIAPSSCASSWTSWETKNGSVSVFICCRARGLCWELKCWVAKKNDRCPLQCRRPMNACSSPSVLGKILGHGTLSFSVVPLQQTISNYSLNLQHFEGYSQEMFVEQINTCLLSIFFQQTHIGHILVPSTLSSVVWRIRKAFTQ